MPEHVICLVDSDRGTDTATVDAEEPISGLLVYRIPDWVDPTSPYRWRIGHHSGAVIAATSDEDKAHAGVAALADRADWTAGLAAMRAAFGPEQRDALWADLRTVGCYHAGTLPMPLPA